MNRQFDLVVFDVDGTLTKHISWFEITRLLGASIDEHKTIYESLKEKKLTLETARKKMVQLWNQTGNANKPFLEELFVRWPIHSEAFEIMPYLKQKGYKVCLISGAVDLYVQTIAKRFGIEFWFANAQFVWDIGEELTDFKYDVDQATRKLEQLKGFIRSQHISLDKCVCIGDSLNDSKLFENTKGILVKTEIEYLELKKYAWKEINNLLELNTIL